MLGAELGEAVEGQGAVIGEDGRAAVVSTKQGSSRHVVGDVARKEELALGEAQLGLEPSQ